MFSKSFKIYGTHANMIEELVAAKVLSRNIDAYCICPLIGLQYKKKSQPNKNNRSKEKSPVTISTETFNTTRLECVFVYQTYLLITQKGYNQDSAFADLFSCGPKNIESNAYKSFIAHMLGGIEILYNAIMNGEKIPGEEDKLDNFMEFIDEFNNDYVNSNKVNLIL